MWILGLKGLRGGSKESLGIEKKDKAFRIPVFTPSNTADGSKITSKHNIY